MAKQKITNDKVWEDYYIDREKKIKDSIKLVENTPEIWFTKSSKNRKIPLIFFYDKGKIMMERIAGYDSTVELYGHCNLKDEVLGQLEYELVNM